MILVLIGCSNQTEVPPGVLSHDEMVRVLIDVHILESKVKKLYLNHDSSKSVYKHYEKMLFSDLGITREQYNESLDYYVGEIEELNDIYNDVSDSLLARTKTSNYY